MKYSKVVCLIGATALFTGCSMLSLDSIKSKEKAERKNAISKSQGSILGGWYPIFFNDFNKEEVDKLIKSINSGKAKQVVISYDNNKELAEQINKAILQSTKFKPQVKHSHNEDSETLKFNHEKVVVTVHM